MSTALVLEGGGMRGLYTAGVLDAFLEAGIQVDAIVGVSAGALFGVNMASNQPGRALRYNKKYIHHPNYMSVKSLVTTGNMVNKDLTYYEIPRYLDVFDEETFEKSGIDFYVVATNVHTGEPDYLKIENVFDQMEAFRASSALPLVAKTVVYRGKEYMDGGFSDSIPVDFAKSLGYDKVIVVLTRPKDYRKKKSNGLLYKTLYRRYPKFVDAATNRYKLYNRQVERVLELEKQGDIFVVRPHQALDIGRLEKDPKKFDEIHGIGLSDAKAAMADLQDYLAC